MNKEHAVLQTPEAEDHSSVLFKQGCKLMSINESVTITGLQRLVMNDALGKPHKTCNDVVGRKPVNAGLLGSGTVQDLITEFAQTSLCKCKSMCQLSL